MRSMSSPLSNGVKHVAGFIMDPVDTVAGTLNELHMGNVPLTPDDGLPGILRTFVQGRYIPDEGNAGARADWAAAASIAWGAHEQAIRAALRGQDVPSDVVITLDRSDAPRLVTLRGRGLEVSFLLSACTTEASERDGSLWTSEAHCRRAFWGLSYSEQSRGAGRDEPDSHALSSSEKKAAIRALACAGLAQSAAKRQVAASWALAVFVVNNVSRKNVRLAAATYALLVELVFSLAHGKHTHCWSVHMSRRGEALEASSAFSAAAAVYAELAHAVQSAPAMVGGAHGVFIAWSNLGLAHKRASEFGPAVTAYQQALRCLESADPPLPADMRRRLRNRGLQQLAQLYRSTKQETQMHEIMNQIFELAIAEAVYGEPSKRVTHMFAWDDGGIPTLTFPQLGRRWRMGIDGVVTEDPRQASRTTKQAHKSAKDAYESLPEQESAEERMRQFLPKGGGSANACAECGCVGPNMLKCARCKADCYCSKACQKAAWPAHKQVCRKPQ
jgi:hypothetical protein